MNFKIGFNYKTFRKQLLNYEPLTLLKKDENVNLAHNNKDNAEILAKYFNKLLNCDHPIQPFDIKTDAPIKTLLEHINAPTVEEVNKAPYEMKNHKVTGGDQTFADTWKNIGKSVKIKLFINNLKI